MTPKTDNSLVIAYTLAIIQGKESPATVKHMITRHEFESVYPIAQELDRNHYIALFYNETYMTVKHATKWSRLVR